MSIQIIHSCKELFQFTGVFVVSSHQPVPDVPFKSVPQPSLVELPSERGKPGCFFEQVVVEVGLICRGGLGVEFDNATEDVGVDEGGEVGLAVAEEVADGGEGVEEEVFVVLCESLAEVGDHGVDLLREPLRVV